MNRTIRVYRLLAVSLLLIAISVAGYGSSTGITGKTKKNGTGCTCHSASVSTAVTVLIEGPDLLKVGETGTFSVKISGGPLSAAGTNIAASGGVLNILSGSDLKKIGDELTHTGPKSPTSGTVTFNFSYTAPATQGTTTLYADGNSINLNGSTSGDQWNFATNKTIQVQPATKVPDANAPAGLFLDQNFPNPFNPATKIRFSIPEGLDHKTEISLRVFDILGHEVAVLTRGSLTGGLHEFDFDASSLPVGIYLYQLRIGEYRETRRMLYLK